MNFHIMAIGRTGSLFLVRRTIISIQTSLVRVSVRLGKVKDDELNDETLDCCWLEKRSISSQVKGIGYTIYYDESQMALFYTSYFIPSGRHLSPSDGYQTSLHHLRVYRVTNINSISSIDLKRLFPSP